MGVGGAVPATTRDVTLVEVDGKHPWQVPICDRQYQIAFFQIKENDQ